MQLLKKFVGIFTKNFAVFEENNQINKIQLIGKNDDGYAIVGVIPIGSHSSCVFFPHEIISQDVIKKQFAKSDLKIIEALLIGEGDIFLESKEYTDSGEVYFFRSPLTHENWVISPADSSKKKEILPRINKRYFTDQNLKEILINYV